MSRTKIYVKLNAMHKLESFSIGCEDFSIPGGITNGVSASEGFVQPRKGQGEAKLN